MENIYADIAERTGGNVYIGVVGPVRTGKSTLIKRIMETAVIPHIHDAHLAERARDELPQSGSGRTIMTSEPKFVPEEAIEISPDGTCKLYIRMIDSVGYMIPGATGASEDGSPRMVTTPWYDHEIPMTEAAELGTKKVMQEHCSMGIVVTTDGTITDIPRADYEEAEEKAIRDMQQTGKPFLVIINSASPGGDLARSVMTHITDQYGITPMIADCQSLDHRGITDILRTFLYCFPAQEIRIRFPRWMDALDREHPVKASLYHALLESCAKIQTLGQATNILQDLKGTASVEDVTLLTTDLANGCISCSLVFPEKLFYDILSNKTGMPVENDAQLLNLLTELAEVKKQYDKIADALSSAAATGYGIVMPSAEEMVLQPPEVVRKGGAYGVKLKAGAPSIHMIKVDIDTEISPMVGGEQQSQDLISYLSAEEPDKLWQSNIFGKSVYTLIQEGLTAKLLRTPEDVREKFRGSLTRIVNEGATGLICLIL